MLDDELTGQKENAVTAESILEMAQIAGKNLRVIDAKFPKTAQAILIHSQILPDQKLYDNEAIVAKDLVLDYMLGNNHEQSANNKAQGLIQEGDKNGVSPQRVQNGVRKLAEMTSNQSPDALRDKLTAQIAMVEYTLGDHAENLSVNRRENLLARKYAFAMAINELGEHIQHQDQGSKIS